MDPVRVRLLLVLSAVLFAAQAPARGDFVGYSGLEPYRGVLVQTRLQGLGTGASMADVVEALARAGVHAVCTAPAAETLLSSLGSGPERTLAETLELFVKAGGLVGVNDGVVLLRHDRRAAGGEGWHSLLTTIGRADALAAILNALPAPTQAGVARGLPLLDGVQGWEEASSAYDLLRGLGQDLGQVRAELRRRYGARETRLLLAFDPAFVLAPRIGARPQAPVQLVPPGAIMDVLQAATEPADAVMQRWAVPPDPLVEEWIREEAARDLAAPQPVARSVRIGQTAPMTLAEVAEAVSTPGTLRQAADGGIAQLGVLVGEGTYQVGSLAAAAAAIWEVGAAWTPEGRVAFVPGRARLPRCLLAQWHFRPDLGAIPVALDDILAAKSLPAADLTEEQWAYLEQRLADSTPPPAQAILADRQSLVLRLRPMVSETECPIRRFRELGSPETVIDVPETAQSALYGWPLT
ncbi:MAG TPA: hypothetical protein PLQ54_01625 [Armatimonadota bacterium]|nr:hypothetical protein [Armatimonadota bacterium]